MISLEHRLLILSGKGGVGKTTLAIALGLRAAAEGRNTLICEMGEDEKVAPQFGHSAASYVETPLGVPRLSSIYLDPQLAFDDYVRASLRFETLARPLLESRLIRAFVAAAPGFKEIMVLNKLLELERARGAGGRPKYDMIILDAPATGHGLTLFRAPILAMRGSRSGPIFQKARQIAELLQDAARTCMHIVTLAEEMPVSETLEMIEAIRTDVHIALGAILVNAVMPEILAPEQAHSLAHLKRQAAPGGGVGAGASLDALIAVAEQMQGRSQLNAEYLRRLAGRTELELCTLPYRFDVPWTLDSVRQLAAELT